MTTIPFKAVAVDMDGTFLTDKKTFDHQLFGKILNKLHANNIPFISATGNQLIRSHEYFEEFTKGIDYVSENGAILEADGKVIKKTALDYDIAQKLLNFIQTEYPEAIIMVSAEHHCYVLKSMDKAVKDDIRIYYRKVKEIDKFTDIDPSDSILKVCLTADDELATVIQDRFNEKYGDYVRGTSSGNMTIDLVHKGINKAKGVADMLKYYNIDQKDLIAFGDGENDIGMLEACGYSYAMENANAKTKAVSKYEAPSNNENGVLKVLAKYLEIEQKIKTTTFSFKQLFFDYFNLNSSLTGL